MLTRHYAEGRQDTTGNMYFFNGQPARDVKRSNETGYDTALFYYSTGKVKEMALNTHSHAYRSRQNDDLAYYNTMFYNSLTQGNLKKANKYFYHIWRLDSTDIDTYFNFKEGLLLYKEYRYDQAIAAFDKALQK